MPRDNFLQRKHDVLLKIDKSSKGGYDKRIMKLCKKINSLENYYTTSSCSGRVVIMIDQEKKREGLFLKSYHDLISFGQLKKDLNNIIKLNSQVHSIDRNLLTKKNRGFGLINSKQIRASDERGNLIKFKQEPCILHVACKGFDDAKKIYEKAKQGGWKISGIIASGKRFVVEINGTEKLEFPVIHGGKIIVADYFLRLVVKKSNKNLKKSWDRIERLRKSF